jgi:hypothetical protein
MDLIGKQSLYGRRSAAHEDELQIQALALVESPFLPHHHWQDLYARRWKRAAHRLTLGAISRKEKTCNSDNNA